MTLQEIGASEAFGADLQSESVLHFQAGEGRTCIAGKALSKCM